MGAGDLREGKRSPESSERLVFRRVGVHQGSCSASLERRKLSGTSSTLLLLSGVIASLSACDEQGGYPRDAAKTAALCETQAQSTPIVIEANAPMGAGRHHLGRPVDANFQTFSGPAGRSLFVYDEAAPEEGGSTIADPCTTNVPGVFCSPVNSMEHRTFAFQDSRSFSANVSGFRIGPVGVSGGVSTGSEQRYAAYQALQLTHCLEVDDTAALREPPKEAAYYVKKICFGRSYNTVLSGSSSSFNAGVKASFLFASGSVDAFAASNNLEVTTTARGLEPITDQAIFAGTEEEIRQNYRQAGEPTAIVVEYQSIPDTCVPTAQLIEWKEPFNVLVELKELRVHRYGERNWFLKSRIKKNGDTELFLSDPNVTLGQRVDDDCESSPTPDSSGDDDFCRYTLGWSTKVQPVAGDILTVGVSGTAQNGGDIDSILYDEFRIEIGQTNENQCGTIGKSDGNTSYFLDWCIGFRAQ